MKINTRTVWQMTDDGMHIIEQDSYDYDGPVAECFGGRSRTASTTSQDIRNIGISDVEGIAVGAGGDVNFSTVDPGAIAAGQAVSESAFDFAGDFGGETLNFARDVVTQSSELGQRAISTAQQSAATAVTGGASDLAGINAKTIGYIAAAVAAVFIVTMIAKRSK